jgi:hypothetical protein
VETSRGHQHSTARLPSGLFPAVAAARASHWASRAPPPSFMHYAAQRAQRAWRGTPGPTGAQDDSSDVAGARRSLPHIPEAAAGWQTAGGHAPFADGVEGSKKCTGHTSRALLLFPTARKAIFTHGPPVAGHRAAVVCRITICMNRGNTGKPSRKMSWECSVCVCVCFSHLQMPSSHQRPVKSVTTGRQRTWQQQWDRVPRPPLRLQERRRL